jgi:hypothetical protein
MSIVDPFRILGMSNFAAADRLANRIEMRLAPAVSAGMTRRDRHPIDWLITPTLQPSSLAWRPSDRRQGGPHQRLDVRRLRVEGSDEILAHAPAPELVDVIGDGRHGQLVRIGLEELRNLARHAGEPLVLRGFVPLCILRSVTDEPH